MGQGLDVTNKYKESLVVEAEGVEGVKGMWEHSIL